MLSLIPEKYRIEELVWSDNIHDAFYALHMKYHVTEIVPLCLEEFIKMNSRDLIVSNLSKAYTDSICVLTIDSFRAFERLDQKDSSGFTVETVFQYNIYNQHLSDANKGYEGFEMIKSNQHNILLSEHLKRFIPDKYREEFIFKVKAKDCKKIQIDNPSLKLLRNYLSEDEFIIVKKNFKRINNDGKFIGEEK